MDSIEQQLIAQLAKKFDTDPVLSDGLAFLGVDSIGMAELTVDIEREFGIRVEDDIMAVETVQELADYIRERRGTNK